MKKGQTMGLGTMITVVVIFLVVGIAAIYSLDITDDTREDFCDYTFEDDRCYACLSSGYPNFNSTDNQCYNGTTDTIVHQGANMTGETAAFNSTQDVRDGVAKIPDKMPTLGNVVIAAIIIGVLLAAFGGFIAYKRFNG